MQMIAFADTATDIPTCAKSLALHAAQRPLVALANEDLDDAVCAAYRRSDNILVTEGLLRGYLAQRRRHRHRIRGAGRG
jgi:hypothetical protein